MANTEAKNTSINEEKLPVSESTIFKAVIFISISMGIGSIIYPYINNFLK